MTDHKTLRDQVVEAIVAELEVRSPHSIKSIPAFDMTGLNNAADAAIKAVLEGMRCGRCRYWDSEGYCKISTRDDFACELEWCYKNFGCIRWEQKQ